MSYELDVKIPRNVTFSANIRSRGGRGGNVTAGGAMFAVQVSTIPVLTGTGSKPLCVARNNQTGALDPNSLPDQLVLPKGSIPVRFTMVSQHETSPLADVFYNIGSLAQPLGLWANLKVADVAGNSTLTGNQTYIAGIDSGIAASQFGGLTEDYPVYIQHASGGVPLNNLFGIIEYYMWNNGSENSRV